MSDFFAGFMELPGYGKAAVVILLLYALQAELRFGKRARTSQAGAADRNSSRLLKIATTIAIIAFVLALKVNSAFFRPYLPDWFRAAFLPGMPAIAWIGVAFAALGLLLRLWSVLTLRERYSRTLLVHEQHTIEQSGPYRWVRHPGYLGSLLTFNGVALASGNWITFVLCFAVTLAAYAWRIKVEDQMLVTELGEPYGEYRQQVRALIPSFRRTK